MAYRKMILNADDLKLGDCICVIRNKYTKEERLAKGSVALVPYKKSASKTLRQKYGKHLVYVIHRDYEEIVGYFQD